jgi:hypothetical protein
VVFSVAYTYPAHPNAVSRRKYYDFVHNLPLFLPNPEIGDRFAQLLAEYPPQPYLDNRDSFLRWVWFIHNKVNKELDKPQISFHESLDAYLSAYLPQPVVVSRSLHLRAGVLHAILIAALLVLIYAASSEK